MMNLMTDVGSYSVLAPKTGVIKLDAFPAPTNKNCTLTSHGITETSNTGGLKVTDGCTSSRKTECVEIRYPLDNARKTGGYPGPLAYNLVVKYTALNTAAYIKS
jgi:hypothetical protein